LPDEKVNDKDAEEQAQGRKVTWLIKRQTCRNIAIWLESYALMHLLFLISAILRGSASLILIKVRGN